MEEYLWVSKLSHQPVFTSRAHPVLHQLASRYGVKISIVGSRDDSVEPYVNAVRDGIDRGVAGIMVIGWGDAEIARAIDEAMDNGIPVVTVDSDVPDSKRLAHVGTDWFRMGQAMAETLAERMGGAGQALMIGFTGMVNMQAGFKGFSDGIARFGEIEIVGPVDDLDVGPEKAETVTAHSLAQLAELKGIACFDGQGGPGAARAVERARKVGAVSLVCVDSEEDHLDYIRSGTIQAAFCQRREAFTYHAFQVLYAYNHGSPLLGGRKGLINVPGNIDTGFLVVNRSNVDTFESDLNLEESVERHDLTQRLSFMSEIVENVSEMVLVTDETDRIVFTNPAVLEMTGYDSDELQKLSLKEILDVDLETHLSRKASTPPEQNAIVEGGVMTKEGCLIPVQIRLTSLKAGERSRGHLIVAIDITPRKRTEKALHESEATLKATIESTADGILVVSQEGKATHWNARFLEMWNIPKELLDAGADRELLDFVLDQLTDPDVFIEKVKVLYKSTDAALDTIEFKDGRIFERYSSPFLKEGKRTGRIWSFRDITDRKKTEDALRERENFLLDVFASIQDGISVLDNDLKIITVNRKMEEWYAHALPFVGRKCFEVYHGRDETCEKCPTRDTLTTGDVSCHVVPKIGPGGAKIGWLDLYSFPLVDRETGQTKGVIEYVRDITERKRAEEALRASEENYRAILDAVDDAITVHDLEGCETLDVNEKMCAMFGYTREEALGLSFDDLFAGRPHFAQGDSIGSKRLGAAAGEPQTFEWMAHDKKGTYFWVEVNLKRAGVGGRDRLLAVVRDITARKRLEEQLRQSQKMEAVGRLAGGIAHDFNNILAAILGYTGVSIEEMGKDDPFRQSVIFINQAAKRAAELTRQLLAFSRRQVLSVRVLDLNAIIADLERMLRRLIGDDIELVTVFEEPLVKVMADPSQIEQIVMNLAVNARDAMPAGGRLTMKTANVVLDEASARTLADVEPGRYVLITVSDTGQGMDSETLSRVFEPFFTTKEQGKGTGFGLSTVYGIVKQHKGHITLSSEPGQGADFKIYLPGIDRDVEADRDRPFSSSLLIGTENVLVVEDEDLVRKVACKILDMHGYNVLSSSDPRDAIGICERHKGSLNLLLTDVVMPGMDGKALFEELERLIPDLKVVFMSGFAGATVVQDGVAKKGLHFVQKPFTPESLLEQVRRALDE